MNLLTAEHITKSYTDRILLKEADFSLQEGEKVGIIGINGTGKSTLLKILAGVEPPDQGTVTMANHVVIGYLSQNPEFDPEETSLGCILTGAPKEHWNLESEAKTMMTKLGIYNFDQKTGELSGGQRKRLALIKVLLTPADLLILDEPTNHLDPEMSDWLEEYLKKFRGALIMITHDRYFLDSVTNRIVEIDKGALYSYQANYEGYLALKAEREEMDVAGERKRQSILKKEIAWMQRGARARSTKQKAHIQRYEALRDQEGLKSDAQVEMSSVTSRMGKTTVELSHISKRYGDKILLDDFSYIFLKQDRIGFVGANGAGKTTLMRMIHGDIEPDSGEIVVGQTIKIGYFSQELNLGPDAGIAYMNPEDKVIDYIRNTAEFVRTQEGLVSASVMLERFLFPRDAQYSLIGKLSGGEKRRLNLLRVLMEAPNVLILDEPTNDLDIATLRILEDYLDSFDGIVITVSHDRYFLDRVVRRIFAFEDHGKLVQYEGGYTDYRSKTEELQLAKNPSVNENKSQQKGNDWKQGQTKKLKFSYQEQRDYDTIEEDIQKLEELSESLDAQMTANATNSVKLGELMKEKESTEQKLEQKMERWEYLEDLKSQIEAQ